MDIAEVNKVIAEILCDLAELFPTEEEIIEKNKKKPAPQNDTREWEIEQYVEY